MIYSASSIWANYKFNDSFKYVKQQVLFILIGIIILLITAKTNYRIHTNSIKENIIPTLTEKQQLYVYANEADILNVALFGMTAKEWKDKNPTLDGNMRDYANILQLVILSNLENLNSQMIAEGMDQKIRLEKLNLIAKKQYSILQDSKGIKKIEMLDNKSNTKLLS